MTPEPTARSLTQRAIAEVLDLHWFFEDWLGAAGSDPEPSFERLAAAIAPEFRVVTPGGAVLARDALIRAIAKARSSRGSADHAFRIKVEEIEAAELGPEFCLVTYVEHQEGPDGTTTRRASALFRDRPSAPNGVVWVHLQETWLTPAEAD